MRSHSSATGLSLGYFPPRLAYSGNYAHLDGSENDSHRTGGVSWPSLKCFWKSMYEHITHHFTSTYHDLHQLSRILACRFSTCFFNDLLVDNCLVIPKNTTFQQRLLQNQLAYPPKEGDIIWSPATIEIAYNNGAISYITSPKAETYAITGPNCIYSGTMDSMWRLRTIMMQTRPKLAIQRE